MPPPFDPNLPQPHTLADATLMRGQLNSLKDLIDALNAQQITGALVESVGTGNAGDPASVGLSLVNGVLRFSFVLPRGDAGAAGQDGQNGQDGQPGQTGPVGPPFANAVVDNVTTVNPGDNAAVNTTFDGTNVHFTFSIPKGFDGIQGPPGEVTTSQLTNAIAATSSNTNAVSQLGLTVSDPPTQSEMQTLANKLDELIAALKRP